MNESPIISVLNLKNGVGCSALSWNIAHLLELNLYQHDKALHKNFIEQRQNSIENTDLFNNTNIAVKTLNKKKAESGVFDLGADINYAYIRSILKKSNVIVIPIENGYEVLVKSIATVKYIRQYNKKVMILLVFNKLNDSYIVREKNYTSYSETILDSYDIKENDNLQFLYIRHSFAMYKKLENGFYFLDNYLKKSCNQKISQFNLLQNLRFYTVKDIVNDILEDEDEDKKSLLSFYNRHKEFYTEFTKNNEIKEVYDLTFYQKNKKLIKDMLILTTRIRDTYTLREKY